MKYLVPLGTPLNLNVDAKGLPIPKLISPPDKTGNLSVSPTSSGGRATAVITWEDTEKADIYEIQVSEYDQFYNYMYKKVHAGSSATLTDSLKYNTTYYWRVIPLSIKSPNSPVPCSNYRKILIFMFKKCK